MKLHKPLITIIFTLLLCIATNAQELGVSSGVSSGVVITPETAEKCARCFASAEAQNAEKSALEAEVVALKAQQAVTERELLAQAQAAASWKSALEAETRLREICERKSRRRISLLFGVVKIQL